MTVVPHEKAQPAEDDSASSDWHATLIALGYIRCRPCGGEYHRPPECDIDEQGRPLDWEGMPWQ